LEKIVFNSIHSILIQYISMYCTYGTTALISCTCCYCTSG